MPINILMPALSPTMEKGNIARWLKKEGDSIKSGDVLAEIETDKATMEVEAVDEGILAKILVPDGTADVPVNQLIGIIAAEGEDVLDALGPVVDEDVADVGAGVPLAGEVGHRGDGGLAPHPRHQVGGACPGASPGAVGDADEVRCQRFEFGDGAPEAQPAGLVLRGEELERDRRACSEKVGDPCHEVKLGSIRRPSGGGLYEKTGTVSGGSGVRR